MNLQLGDPCMLGYAWHHTGWRPFGFGGEKRGHSNSGSNKMSRQAKYVLVAVGRERGWKRPLTSHARSLAALFPPADTQHHLSKGSDNWIWRGNPWVGQVWRGGGTKAKTTHSEGADGRRRETEIANHLTWRFLPWPQRASGYCIYSGVCVRASVCPVKTLKIPCPSQRMAEGFSEADPGNVTIKKQMHK